MLKNMSAGNLLVPVAILLSGLTFTGFANMAEILNLSMISEATFIRYKKCIYILSFIALIYYIQQEAVLVFLRDEAFTCLVMVDVTVQGIVLNTVLTLLWTVSVTSF